MKTNLTRRQFLKMAGTGLAVAVVSTQDGHGILSAKEMEKAGSVFSPNVWLHIASDGMVTVMVNKSEMGQGVYTAMPMLVAEELDVPWESVRIEQAGAGKEYYHAVFRSELTGGSSSVRGAWQQLRTAGATARAMLIAAAAAAWNASPADCRTENGVVIHTATRRRLKYGELAERVPAGEWGWLFYRDPGLPDEASTASDAARLAAAERAAATLAGNGTSEP